RHEEEARPGRRAPAQPRPAVPRRAVRGRGRDHVARHPRPADRVRPPRLDGLPHLARAGDRREALHPRRHHRQGRPGRADVAGGAAPGQLAGGPLPGEGRRRRGGDGQAPLAGGGVLVIARHLRTFLWLRWRLFVNQLRKGGVVSAVALGLVVGLILLGAAFLFVGSFVAGLLLPPDLSPAVLLLVWDGLVAAFLLFWAGGLLTELQRSEVLAMDKFLHLPVS